MTKGLTGLASHDSNMVAPHEQNYEGGWTIYRTRKSRRALKKKEKQNQSFFDRYLDNSSQYDLFSASSSENSTSTGTGASYADIVKGTIHNSHPPMKIKTDISDQDSTCSEITEDPTIMICTPKLHKPKSSYIKSVPVLTKHHHNHDKTISNPRAAHPDVIPHKPQVQKNIFLDETSIGEIYIKNSRTESRKNKSPKKNHDYPKINNKQPDFETAFSARSSGTKYKHKNGTTTCLKDSPNFIRPINENHITLEQHKLQELCLREISHREKYINSEVLGNPYPTYIDQTIYRKTGEKLILYLI